MSGGLPELLDAVAETLLRPGAFPAEAFRSLRGEAWIGAVLGEALDRLLGAPTEDLAVEYAGLFLVGRVAPTLHLELSPHRHGRHQAPELMAALEPFFAEAGIAPPEGVSIDHLGLLLALLAHGLRRLSASEDSRAEADLRRLISEYLVPFTQELRLSTANAHPFYAADLALAEATLAFTRDLLA